MTAPFLPPIAHREKPPVLRRDFPRVRGRDLASVPGKRGLPFFGILPEAVLDPLAFARRMHDDLRADPPLPCLRQLERPAGRARGERVRAVRRGPQFLGGRRLEAGLRPPFRRRPAAPRRRQPPMAPQARRHRLQAGAAAILSRHLRRQQRARCWRAGPDGRSTSTSSPSSSASPTAMRPSSAATRRSATREDLLAFRYLMRAAAAVVPWPLPGTAEARAAWAKRHVEGLIRPMLAEPVAPERTDLLANLCRMRDAGLLDDDEVMAHLVFVVAASFDTLVVRHRRHPPLSRRQSRVAGGGARRAVRPDPRSRPRSTWPI